MNPGRQLGAERPDILRAPPNDQGRAGRMQILRRLLPPVIADVVLTDYNEPHDEDGDNEEISDEAEAEIERLSAEHERHGERLGATGETYKPTDVEIVTGAINGFMSKLHGTHRYETHGKNVQNRYEVYGQRKGDSEEDKVATKIDKMAIALHDFVDHAILHPEKTAEATGQNAADIKQDAFDQFDALLNEVEDQDDLIKAYLFAIDASKWETAARVWRTGATARINTLVEEGKIDTRTAAIVDAAINKTAMPEGVGPPELWRALKRKETRLTDLKLDAISEGTLNHNIKGLFLKALESLDNILDPPPANPASTYRDCIEALNFFVPALYTLGYKELASDLRGAALEWLVDDPNGDAAHQRAVSETYSEEVKNPIFELLESEFSGQQLEVMHRIKTNGSIREKLTKDRYAGLHLVPDGIGFAFVVPDDMEPSELDQFARSFQTKLLELSPQFVEKHPNPDEPTYEFKKGKEQDGEEERENGYEAINMTFYYYPADGSGVAVPFEIQVLTQTQSKMKLYGRWSDLFFKAGTSFKDEDQAYLDHLAKRAIAEREMAAASTIESIAEMISLTPEIPSVFNKLFRVVHIGDGRRVIVPTELEQRTQKIAHDLALSPGEAGDLTILPPSTVTENQLIEALNMFGGGNLAEHKNIINALAVIREKEATRKRDDGTTPVIEGHLIPTALSALMLAIKSGKIWDNPENSHIEYMSNIVTISLLHDYVEDALSSKDINDPKDILEQRRMMLYDIKSKFGATVMAGVDALTPHKEIENQEERREQYRAQIQANTYARIIKPADRWQNHVSDLVKLEARRLPRNAKLYKQIMRYFAKTDRHQSADFTSSKLPALYARTHDMIWRFARHFGYKPESDDD